MPPDARVADLPTSPILSHSARALADTFWVVDGRENSLRERGFQVVERLPVSAGCRTGSQTMVRIKLQLSRSSLNMLGDEAILFLRVRFGDWEACAMNVAESWIAETTASTQPCPSRIVFLSAVTLISRSHLLTSRRSMTAGDCVLRDVDRTSVGQGRGRCFAYPSWCKGARPSWSCAAPACSLRASASAQMPAGPVCR